MAQQTAIRSGVATEVVSDPSVMGGEPVIRGTRIPVETIVAYFRDGYDADVIFQDYPSLPIDGIAAAIDWAERTLGSEWKTSLRAD
jgi:uncharacterized protein (DUF433 family)